MRLPIDLRIAWHGVIVLLLGMVTGFFIGRFHSHTLGNAAHLTGLIGGYGLITFGLLWPRLGLRSSWSKAGAGITVVSMYLNWAGLVLQDAFGIRSNPLMHSGPIVLAIAVVLSLVSVAIVLIGLRSPLRAYSDQEAQDLSTSRAS